MLICCVCTFSLHRESPDMILGDESLILEVVLSHVWVSQDRFQSSYGSHRGLSIGTAWAKHFKSFSKSFQGGQVIQETPPPIKSKTESPEVMEMYSNWHTPFMIYFRTGGLPEDNVEWERLRRRAGQYILVNDEPFHQSVNISLMNCITPNEGCDVLQDIHEGIWGSHVGARSCVGKAYRQGFFWPTTVSGADSLVRRCEGCQFFARQKHMTSHQLQTIPIVTSWNSHFGMWTIFPTKKT
jgi:hypothetical protein